PVTSDRCKTLFRKEGIMTRQDRVSSNEASSAPQIDSIDYVEFYVGNARQAAQFYCTTFGFTLLAYAGLETGARDRVSYVIGGNDIRLMLTTALDPDSPVAEHVKYHGDGIKDIAFNVKDAAAAFELALKRGARPVAEPAVIEDEHGRVAVATIAAYG